MMDDDRLYAVISGDIVESRRFMEKGPALRDAIKGAYWECSEAFCCGLDGLPVVDVFAGDSWQVLVNSPDCALRIALCMRALIQCARDLPGVDTRVAIGVGALHYIGDDRLSMSQGEAFTLSGEALRQLERRDTCRLAAVIASEAGDEEAFAPRVQHTLDTMMLLLDTICAGWTASQAQSAQSIGISQPAVSQSLRAAHWSAVEAALDWWKALTSGQPAVDHGFSQTARKEMR